MASDRLWLCVGPRGLCTPDTGTLDAALRRFARRHRITGPDGSVLESIDRRRLRKSFKRDRYLTLNGVLPDFADGHAVEIAARHYADLPSLRHLHEATVADALTDALAVTHPRVAATAELQDLAAHQGATLGALGREATGRIVSGHADVFVAACVDITHSPFGPPGQLCPTPFTGCFTCPNAVFTARRLAAVIAYQRHCETERGRWPPAEWQRRYGAAHQAIVDDILPAMTAEEIDAAHHPSRQRVHPSRGPTVTALRADTAAERPALAGLPADTEVLGAGRFADDVWDLTPLLRRRRRAERLYFTAVPVAFRQPVKGFAWLALRTPAAVRKARPRLDRETVVAEVRHLRRLAGWLVERDVTTFAAVTQSLLDDYVSLRRQQLKASTLRGLVKAIQRLAAHSAAFNQAEHHFTVVPWRGRPATVIAGSRPSGENTTQRIPEEVMAPLLRCALLYVEKFSDDIIAARREAAGLAWHIRNRPFGHVAGAIQYQHAQITMFEGYAGTSASGFRQEVEAEREAANLAELFHLVVGAPNWGTP